MSHQQYKRAITAQLRKNNLKNLATALFLNGRIMTTLAKAKAVQPYADHLVSVAKKETLTSRRIIENDIHSKEAVDRLFNTHLPSFGQRNGSFTQVLKAGFRKGDSAPMGVISFVSNKGIVIPEPEKKKNNYNKHKKNATTTTSKSATASESTSASTTATPTSSEST